jgi:hypothetical protein
MTVWDWSKVRVRELKQERLQSKTEPFAMLPLAWAAKAAAATNSRKAMVWIWIIQEARKTGSDTVVVSNEKLARYGVSRRMKDLALRQLEVSGLITVKRHPGKAPLVRRLP